MNRKYFIWIEIQANKDTIADADQFKKAMEQCKQAGIGAVILGVKDTSGFTIYESGIAPHYCEYDPVFEHKDYLKECLAIVHELGMKFYASVDVFAEGNKRKKHPKMPGLRNTDWQTCVYGLNEEGESSIQPVADETKLQTVGSIDDFGEIFVNPANEEVCSYELSLLDELMKNYEVDGIVLDRARYVGLSSDFSPITRTMLSEHIGKEFRWPEDIFRIVMKDNELAIEYGRYFGEFITLRAGIIHGFIERVRKLTEAQQRKVEFWDYTGSWYPLYYQVGANWASENYETAEYPWVDLKQYQKTGYAEKLDGLLSGFYYTYVTEQEAKDAKQPAYWYSVEGSGRLAALVTMNAVPIVGSLFLDQYRDHPEAMTQAVSMCMKKSAGCMLFDLSYLVDNDWWKYVTVGTDEEYEQKLLQESSLTKLSALWRECFPEEFIPSEGKLYENTFGDELFCKEASFGLVDKENQLIGAVICKKAKAGDELYPNCAWLTALLVKPDYRNTGLGTKLYQAAEEVLKKQSVRKIFAGQDYQNFFSGIPAPSPEKQRFFQKLGYTINCDEHYDLESDITCNKKIEEFDTASFTVNYHAEALKEGEYEALYDFLEQEFPGRWLVTAKEHLEHGGSPENIVVLKNNTNQAVKGFCMVAVNEDKSGGLGPIGIAKSIRGHRCGDFLVQQSLLHLRKLGGVRICIDWTILKDFYGKFDFKPVRTYRGAYKEIIN